MSKQNILKKMEICVKHFLGCVKFIFNHDPHGLGCEKNST